MTAAERTSAPRRPSRLSVPADLERLAEVRRFVRAAARDVGADDHMTADLVQAVDESVANVIVHGYRGAGGEVSIDVVLDEEKGDGATDGFVVKALIRDRCPTFDPTTVPDPDLDLPLERRRPGGLGVYLARSLVDRVRHRPLPDGGNELELTKRIESRRGGGPDGSDRRTD